MNGKGAAKPELVDVKKPFEVKIMLKRSTFFIREHIGLLKFSDEYDILDPESQTPIGFAKEKPGRLIHLLRFLINKQMLPTCVEVYEGNESNRALLFSIKRGITLLRSKVTVVSNSGQVVGWFKSKVFSLGGAFRIFDSNGREVGSVVGDWKGWNFRFLDLGEKEIGMVTKKWAGIGKELFTSADNYIINIKVIDDETQTLLLLAAGLAIDLIYKEG